MHDDKAGGNAMRRPREAGIVMLLLLGLSGCAGVQQRLSWASPSASGADQADARPTARLSWWRRPPTEAAAPSSPTLDFTETSRAGSMAGDTRPASTIWPERRDGLLRYVPLLGRRWN